MNRDRFLPRTVRQRNLRAARKWWQPSRSHTTFRRSRSVELAAAIEDDLIDDIDPVGPEEPVVRYLSLNGRCRVRLFDPELEALRETARGTLRCEMRRIEASLPLELRNAQRGILERELARKTRRLRRIEGALSVVA
jgi:hypothetical protein